MKTIISTGQGRLHLFEVARVIKNNGIDINIITGWVPSKKTPDKLINIIGRLAGSKNIAYGLRKRQPKELDPYEIKTCTFAEFLFQFLFILSKFKLIKRDIAAVWGWKFYGWSSKKYIKNADIFHVRSGAGQGGAIKRAKKRGMKVVVDHSIAHPNEVYKQMLKADKNAKNITIYPNSKFWKLVMKDCYEADIIFVNSFYVKQSFIDNGFESEKIEVLHWGNNSIFNGIKKEYSFSKESIKLIFTGGFGLRKGGHLIIESIQQLISQKLNFSLDILGTVLNDIDIPSWFRNHPQIKFHGHLPQDDLKDYFINSDLYIFPSYSEGAAQSLKEAMAAGLAVIATVQSGAPIIHGTNGWIIPDNSSLALKNAIIRLSEDGKLRKKLGQNAAKTIKKDHTWSKYGENVAELYTILLNQENQTTVSE